MELDWPCWKFWFGPRTSGLLVKNTSRLWKSHTGRMREQVSEGPLPRHGMKGWIWILIDSNAELNWDRSGIKARRIFFRNSCHAEAFCLLFLIQRNRAEIRSYDVWFINLLCLLNLICQEFQSITRSTDVSSWQPVISGCSEVIFLLDPPAKGLKFTIKQYHVSCLLATSGPGTKFLPNSVTVKVREAVCFLMLDGSYVWPQCHKPFVPVIRSHIIK